MQTSLDKEANFTPMRKSLQEQVRLLTAACTQCQRCVLECQFLKIHGDPKKLAESYAPADNQYLGLPFECSLCGLCAAVCPHAVDPVPLFLEMRRETVGRGTGNFPEHKGLIAYERKGTSKRFSWYALPSGCDTIFFPGCGLPGTRPEQTLQTLEALQQQIASIGVVLDCCTKPSHDLGRESYFTAMFGEMKDFLLGNGIKRVLVACSNCALVFRNYAPELETLSIYEFFDQATLPDTGRATGTVNVHDPCVSRYDAAVHDAVRNLIRKKGLCVTETKHHRRTTFCCGEGGAVACMAPELAQDWTIKRSQEASAPTITYCTGCANSLGEYGTVSHLIDLVLTPEATASGKVKVAKSPLTYLNRLKVKKHLQKNFPAAVTRERNYTAGDQQSRSAWKKLAIFGLVFALIYLAHTSGVTDYLQQDRLRVFIAGYGYLAPLVYMLVFGLAPALFLPGLPISVVGAILFGPFWGVVYTIFSATVGACLAFLISRYLARDWIESKLHSPRWRQLDQQVETHGWKMVAFTRLIPLFPFNLLNYAFGLTRIKFSHYALASFIFMLPGTIAFITFSSSLLDIIRGKVSPSFFIGLALMVLMSLLPFVYRRHRRVQVKQAPPVKQ